MTPVQLKVLAEVAKYFITTNRLGADQKVNVSGFGYSRLIGAPYTLKEVTKAFETYKLFLEAVNREVAGTRSADRSPRHVTGIFTREVQLERNEKMAARRELLQLEAELEMAEAQVASLGRDKEVLKAKERIVEGAVKELKEAIASKQPKPAAKPAAKPVAKPVEAAPK